HRARAVRSRADQRGGATPRKESSNMRGWNRSGRLKSAARTASGLVSIDAPNRSAAPRVGRRWIETLRVIRYEDALVERLEALLVGRQFRFSVRHPTSREKSSMRALA